MEELIPEPGSEVPAQHAVGIDVTDSPRYVIELFLNGQRLPDADAEMRQAKSTNRAVYQPGRDGTVTKLRAGENCVRAVFYPLAEVLPRRAGARSAGASEPPEHRHGPPTRRRHTRPSPSLVLAHL